jgi:hypothetical protein
MCRSPARRSTRPASATTAYDAAGGRRPAACGRAGPRGAYRRGGSNLSPVTAAGGGLGSAGRGSGVVRPVRGHGSRGLKPGRVAVTDRPGRLKQSPGSRGHKDALAQQLHPRRDVPVISWWDSLPAHTGPHSSNKAWSWIDARFRRLRIIRNVAV